MSIHAGEKLARTQIKQAGLELVFISNCGSGHIKTRLRAPDGREEVHVFPRTPSDRTRGALNKQAELRRFARGQSHKHERQAA
jgi:hypothetical protein